MLLIAAVLVAACGGSPSPTRSSPVVSSTTTASPSTPVASAITNWNGAQRFLSVTGPDNCWVREQREWLTPSRWPDLPIKITRSAGSITVESEYWAVRYVGKADGSEFSATGTEPLEGG